ncbi:hypothetical protein JOC34_000811 [Virgibacillus halotolerans]|uniref:YolD-like family protein n=1 Tax=Virgibacillus halotolerans TaxID=1071053 RepID=UPI0019612C08|nr:YolD-like family protein [Virgibacillus halotolerans]MBM7598454.1 hypothetical protein [Virgibacillus halotolerans]
MDVNDRGTKKWTSLMMPEHIQMLDELWKEDDKKTKPIIDEQQREEFDIKLQIALKDHLTVEVVYFVDYDFHTVKGKLDKIDVLNGRLHIDNMRIDINDVIEVTIT